MDAFTRLTKALQYIKDNKIKATITDVRVNGFEYMLDNGECYYISFEQCKKGDV